MAQTSPLLRLPPELRVQIWNIVSHKCNIGFYQVNDSEELEPTPSMFQVCSLIREEYMSVWMSRTRILMLDLEDNVTGAREWLESIGVAWTPYLCHVVMRGYLDGDIEVNFKVVGSRGDEMLEIKHEYLGTSKRGTKVADRIARKLREKHEWYRERSSLRGVDCRQWLGLLRTYEKAFRKGRKRFDARRARKHKKRASYGRGWWEL